MKKAIEVLSMVLAVAGFAAILVVVGQGIEHDYPRSTVPLLVWACSWAVSIVIGLLLFIYEKGFEHGKSHSPESD